MNDYLKPEDYVEAECLLCMDKANKGKINSIPVQRVMEKLDAYFAKNDYEGAKRHLCYWESEAIAGNDLRGMFAVYNEMLGLYRKLAEKENALNAIKKIKNVIGLLEMENSVSSATAYLNMATVYKAFSEPEKAIPLFDKALEIYKKELEPNDSRFGGLYNNFGLALCDLERFDEAFKLYNMAISVMEKCENGELEATITHLNIADLYYKKDALRFDTEINRELDIAEKLLDTPTVPRDGYYAFVCEKCADTFEFYGRFYYKNELIKRTNEICERS